MIVNNPQEYFVIVRSISCSELGIAEDRCFRNEEIQTGTQTGNQTGNSGGTQTGIQNGYQNGSQTGNQNGYGTGNQSGNYTGNQNEYQSADQPGTQAGNPGGAQTGNQNGYQPENSTGNQNGNQTGNQNGYQNGNQTGNQNGYQSGYQPDQEGTQAGGNPSGTQTGNQNGYQNGNQWQNQMGTQLQQDKNIDGFIKERIRYFFFKTADLSSMASMKQIYRILNSLYTSIINAHVNNIECLQKVKNGEIKNMTADEALKMHLDKFKKDYDYLVSTFNCTSEAGAMDENTLNSRLNDLDREINNTIKEAVSRTQGFTVEEIYNIYRTAVRTLIDLMAQYVPCFKTAQPGSDGQTFEEIANTYYNELQKIFYEYLSLLNCD